MNSNERRFPFSVGDIGFICLFMVSLCCKELYSKVRKHAENFLQKLYKSWVYRSMTGDNQLFLVSLLRKETKR